MLADEPIGGPTKGEGVAEEVVAQPSSSSIKNVGEHDVHCVLGSD